MADPAQGESLDQGDELPEVLTVDEAAALLRVNRKTIYEAVARKKLPALRIGRVIRISRAAVLEWLQGHGRVSRRGGSE